MLIKKHYLLVSDDNDDHNDDDNDDDNLIIKMINNNTDSGDEAFVMFTINGDKLQIQTRTQRVKETQRKIEENRVMFCLFVQVFYFTM